jgi:hypothetical protein
MHCPRLEVEVVLRNGSKAAVGEASFDHFARASEKWGRNVEGQRLGGLDELPPSDGDRHFGLKVGERLFSLRFP